MHPRLGVASNLPSGATYDLLITVFSEGYPEGKLTFNITNLPRKITGIQKVSQLFIKVLFTTAGSDVINPSLGTDFSNLVLNANKTSDVNELYNNILWEVKSAESQVRTLTSDNDNASRLESVEIIAMEVVEEGVMISMKILTGAGESAYVALPSPLTDLETAA